MEQIFFACALLSRYDNVIMHLRHGESILRIVRRHPTPYVIKLLFIALLGVPFVLFLAFLARQISGRAIWYVLLFLLVFAGLILAILSLDYFLDKLIITNKRIIWVNWIHLFHRNEHEVEFRDIQEISIQQRGILAKIPFFNFGYLNIETAASAVSIQFPDCPDPSDVKHFLILQMTHRQ